MALISVMCSNKLFVLLPTFDSDTTLPLSEQFTFVLWSFLIWWPTPVNVAKMAEILTIQDNHTMIVTRNDAGSSLYEAVCINDTTMVQTILSASGEQSYINSTDVDGRTPPIFQAASKGHTFIVSKLIVGHSNVHLPTTTDTVTPLFVPTQNGHDVVTKFIVGLMWFRTHERLSIHSKHTLSIKVL